MPARRHTHGPGRVLRVAVVDHETEIAGMLIDRSRSLDWEVRLIDRPVAIEDLTAMRLNAIVVDIASLPGLHGVDGTAGTDRWDWLRHLAESLPQLAILVCTAPAALSERVRGLTLGADDWLSKTCHPEELIARIQRATTGRRQPPPPKAGEPLRSGDLQIRFDHQQAFAGGLSAQLTPREFEILTLLASSPGIALEREEIYARIWGYTMLAGDRSVDVFIAKLRAKLRRVSPGWEYLHTHFGFGYRFAARPLDASDRQGGAGVAA
jgi:DNA-binding response OmpR family regulator